MFCSKCGHELGYNNLCSNPSCTSNNHHVPVSNLYNNSYSSQKDFNFFDEVTTDDVATFVGERNTEYYLNQWGKHKSNTNFISWNWPGFFFSWLWFAYRKMYGYAALIYFGPSALYILATILPDKATLVLIPLIMIGVRIAVPLFANQLYTKYIDKSITSIKTSIPGRSDEAINRRLQQVGGVNWTPVIVISIIAGFYMILIIGMVSMLVASSGGSF